MYLNRNIFLTILVSTICGQISSNNTNQNQLLTDLNKREKVILGIRRKLEDFLTTNCMKPQNELNNVQRGQCFTVEEAHTASSQALASIYRQRVFFNQNPDANTTEWLNSEGKPDERTRYVLSVLAHDQLANVALVAQKEDAHVIFGGTPTADIVPYYIDSNGKIIMVLGRREIKFTTGDITQNFCTIGGFQERGQRLQDTAIAEGLQEINAVLVNGAEGLTLVSQHSEPDRDPRGKHINSTLFIGELANPNGIKPQEEILELYRVPVDSVEAFLTELKAKGITSFCDHETLIREAAQKIKETVQKKKDSVDHVVNF